MSQEIWVETNLTTETCIDCGCIFAMPCELREQRLEDHEKFYCPNGHGMNFPAKTKKKNKKSGK